MREDQVILEFKQSYAEYRDKKNTLGLGIMRIPDEVIEKYVAIKALGLSRREIFEKTGLTESLVSSLNKRVQDKKRSKSKFKPVKIVPSAQSKEYRFCTSCGVSLVVQDLEVALSILKRL